MAAVLQGCTGSSTDQPEQPSTATPVIQGTVADGTVIGSRISVIAEGASGVARTSDSGNTGNTGDQRRYNVSSTDLVAPYMLSYPEVDGTFLYAVATGSTTANITTLSTLLVAQLFGQDPGTAFSSFGPTSPAVAARITDANIAVAQSKVIDYLQNVLGVTMRPGTGDFLTAAFTPVAGDPMYDTLVDLNAKLAATGSTLAQLASAIAAESGRCLAEHLTVSIGGGSSSDFCPSSKSSIADATDATIQNDTFKNSAGAVLLVRARDGDILSAQLTDASGTTFLCSGCAGLTLGAAASDGGRTLTFGAVALTGATGTAAISGMLTVPAPGVPLPVLPCADDRYVLIYSDNIGDGACIDPDNSGLAFGNSFDFGASRIAYQFGIVNVEIEAGSVAGVSVSRTDPNTGESSVYACNGTTCNDTQVGPTTVDDSLGIPVDLNTVTLNDTLLHQVQSDGTLSTTNSVVVRLSVHASYVPSGSSAPQPCFLPSPSTVVATYSDDGGPVALCPPDPGIASGFGSGLGAFPVDGGGFVYNVTAFYAGSAGSRFGDQVKVFTDASGAVTSVALNSALSVVYGCTGSACSGVTVSPADPSGNVTITFSALALAEQTSFLGFLPDRTASLTGAFTVPPYVPPVDGQNARSRPQWLSPNRRITRSVH